MNRHRFETFGDPETLARIEQYETAFRRQTSTPDLVDLIQESQATLDLYDATPGEPSFANNCLLARRLAERGVRFIQLYDMGWDSHNSLVAAHQRQYQVIDRPAAALIRDLKQRGMLDDTLVIWGGEFGRTPVAQTEGGKWARSSSSRFHDVARWRWHPRRPDLGQNG